MRAALATRETQVVRMSTTISVLGGVGLFLIGMSVMTGGFKALAGSGLRTTLRKAAATRCRARSGALSLRLSCSRRVPRR
jgi:hypothetical protein